MAEEAMDWARWGHLGDRYRDVQRPHRVLALDGGGIRGLISLGVLRALEDKLGRGSRDFRLCQFFDLIGGTSTGAIIAAGLARGMSVADISDFYAAFGRRAFTRRVLWSRWRTLYARKELAGILQETFGADTTLHPEHLHCVLVVVTRNVTTDSAWPVSSNPFARYNEPSRPDSNLNIPLWQLVRASTAAPVYFRPEVVSLGSTTSFAFVDGGTTAYNNPALLLFRMATEPAYGFSWPAGEDELLVVSVGTGNAPAPGRADAGAGNVVQALATTLSALISQISVDQDLVCRIVGRCAHGEPIDRELGDLVSGEQRAKLFRYVRYNPTLTEDGLARLGIAGLDAKAVRPMDAVAQADNLALIGARVGEQVDLAHLGSFVS